MHGTTGHGTKGHSTKGHGTKGHGTKGHGTKGHGTIDKKQDATDRLSTYKRHIWYGI